MRNGDECWGTVGSPSSEKLEESVLAWVYDRRARGFRVSQKLIIETAKIMYDEIIKNGEENNTNVDFLASTAWLQNSMKRNGLSLQRKSSIVQNVPDKLVDKLISFILHDRRLSLQYQCQTSNILATDEAPVWLDMVSDTTVDTTGTNTVTVI